MRRRLFRVLRTPWTALVVALALCAGIALEVSTLSGGDLPAAPDASRDAARRFAVAVTSFDHKRLDADIARVLALGNATFERDFRGAMGADFAKRFADNKTVSVGRIVAGPRVQRAADGRATFLVVVDQRITSEAKPDATPQLDQIVLLVTVEDDGAKVANVDEVWRS